MLKENVSDALNAQINAEMFSAYLYMSMSAYFKSVNLDGFSSWMEAQAQEEMMHAKKFYDFINQRGGRVVFKQIETPQSEWNSCLHAFEEALTHEQKITGLINQLVDIAHEARDHATSIFLQWFVSEQVEEEESVGGVVERLKLVEESKGGLFMIDQELSKRPMPFVATTPEAA